MTNSEVIPIKVVDSSVLENLKLEVKSIIENIDPEDFKNQVQSIVAGINLAIDKLPKIDIKTISTEDYLELEKWNADLQSSLDLLKAVTTGVVGTGMMAFGLSGLEELIKSGNFPGVFIEKLPAIGSALIAITYSFSKFLDASFGYSRRMRSLRKKENNMTE